MLKVKVTCPDDTKEFVKIEDPVFTPWGVDFEVECLVPFYPVGSRIHVPTYGTWKVCAPVAGLSSYRKLKPRK
jgi:hypothetical protein